jgi:4-hydroxybenzoyl-CoA reductase subunit beta
MRLPDFEHVEAKSIEEACAFLEQHGQECKVMAGGTDLFPSMKQRILKPRYVVHLGAIPGLCGIEFDEREGLRIGALVRLHSLETAPEVLDRYPMISQAAGAVGSVQLRHMGTVGGNLSLDTRCYYYNQSDFWRRCRPTCIKMGGETCNAVGGAKKCFGVFSGDLAPALMALGAKVRLKSSKGERVLPLDGYYTGDGAKPLAIAPEEVLVGVEVPAISKGAFGVYLKYRVRKSIDFPLAAVGAYVDLEAAEKTCAEAKVVIGAVGTKPEEVRGIGEVFKGRRITDSLIEEASEMAFKAVRPVANTASSPAYRRKMVKILVERALLQAVGR